MIGGAAVAIWCDIAMDVRSDFNHWHAHEHMPERLAIPGFLRGSRWVADHGEGYFILYEAQSEEAITGRAYLERLNNPTPWSRAMMPHHRNMVRGACRVESRHGAGLGQALLAVRFAAPGDAHERLRPWLAEILAAMPARPGFVSTGLLRHIAQPKAPLTMEQQLRGGDRTPDWVVLANGYSAEALAAAAARELGDAELVAHGAIAGSVVSGLYRLAYVLTAYTERPEEPA
jgi:hypothetical protein